MGKILLINVKKNMLLKKILIALGFSFLLAFFAIIPQLGYVGEASVEVVERHPTGFLLLDAKFNVTFSPFLYPFSWISGYGSPTGVFRTVSVPTYVGYGEFKYPAWKKPAELEDEIMIKVIVSELPINIVFNFIFLLIVELTQLRVLYYCVIAGIFGFPIAGPLGAIIGFFVGPFLYRYFTPKIKDILDVTMEGREQS